MMAIRSWIGIVCLGCCVAIAGEPRKGSRGGMAYPPDLPDAKVEVYRTVGDTKLNLYIFSPPGHRADDRKPAIVFFFGGGWKNGSPAQFSETCRYLASRGMVAMTADYRVASRHDVKAVDCVKDAQAAVRWIRANAVRLGIDAGRIAAGGGSAGGHIAACTGTVRDIDDPEAKIGSRPAAMVLFNPVMALAAIDGVAPDADLSEALKGRMGIDPEAVSPAHHVAKGTPPTIMFFGTQDRLLAGAESFARGMKSAGNRCELVTYKDQGHGFFNYGRGGNEYFRKTLEEADRFLASLGWLKGEPSVGKHLETVPFAK